MVLNILEPIMSESTFDILSISQTVSVDIEHLSATHDLLYAYLNVPINFVFRAAHNTGFEILPVHAELFSGQTNQLLSDVFGPWVTSVGTGESKSSFVLKFKLSDTALHFIEKSRTGDLSMTVGLKIHTLQYQISGGRMNSETFDVRISLNVPRSVWVEKLLPQTGFRNLKLIEVPITHSRLKEAYAAIIVEFDKAEKYFNLQDYNKCVAHCRSTMDTLTNHLKLVKDESTSRTASKWLKNISQETLTWIDQMNKATQAITSKAHHAGNGVDFQRYEAESIYLVVLGLLHHVGNLANDHQP